MADLPVPLLPRRVRWAFVVAVALGIFYFSVLKAPPEQAVVPHFELIPLDKWRHFLGYGVFAATLWYATVDWSWPTRTLVVLVLGTTVAYGLGMEVVQATVPERYFSLFDAYANTLGALLVTPVFYLDRYLTTRRFPDPDA
ncbi:MAG: VanZ family protein [Halodesulfurarchaeum sp.]